MKSLIVRLIISEVLTGSWKHCIMCVGMAESTDLANVSLPAMVNVLVFQLHNLASSREMRLLKSECLGDLIWIGKPR